MWFNSMLKQTLIFETIDGLEIIVLVSEVVKLFSDNKNKQQCFLGFEKENQLVWCRKFINKNNIEDINYKVSTNV